MQGTFSFAGEITQVLDAIPWVRCASGNVLMFSPSFSFLLCFLWSFAALVLLGVRGWEGPVSDLQLPVAASTEFHGWLQEINLPPPSFLNFIFSYCSAIAPVVRLRISKSCQNHLELHLWLPNYVLLTVRTEKSFKKLFNQLRHTLVDFVILRGETGPDEPIFFNWLKTHPKVLNA